MEQKNARTGAFSVLPFYIFITIVLGLVGTNASLAVLRAGDAALALTSAVLFLAYIGMYWLNLRVGKNRRWWLFYYPVQTGLIVMISILLYGKYALGVSVLGSTVLCMIGEGLGWWGNTRRSLLLGLFYAGLAIVLLFFLVGRSDFGAAVSNLFVNGVFIVLFMVVLNQQFTEREKAQELAERLESANARLAANAAQIESLTLQNERQRMARALHDTLAQGVAGLVLQLEAVKAHLAAGRVERAAGIVDQALARARGTLAQSRAAINDLRAAPSSVADSVRDEVERFTQATGIPCGLELTVQDNHFPTEIHEHALSILSEALANITRHAQATSVDVKFKLDKGQLALEVRDNGKGFDVDQRTAAGHYGLLGMRERARLTGGALTIESNRESGTRVNFVVTEASGGML